MTIFRARQTKWTPPLAAILQLFAGMSDLLGSSDADCAVAPAQEVAQIQIAAPLVKYLPHMLNPLYRILDDDGDVSVINNDTELGRSRRAVFSLARVLKLCPQRTCGPSRPRSENTFRRKWA